MEYITRMDQDGPFLPSIDGNSELQDQELVVEPNMGPTTRPIGPVGTLRWVQPLDNG